MRQAFAEKIFVMGIDGMDPRLTKKYLDEGKLPNIQKLISRGSCREDLVMLGAQPTITPPMWTTLATGTYPATHGITCYFRATDELDTCAYNLDSRNCKAEPLWNVLAEAGKKTLVFHWAGSSWPPTSDNPNLMVVDGTQPSSVNLGTAQTETELVLVADVKTDKLIFLPKVASDGNIPCVSTDLKVTESKFDVFTQITTPTKKNIIITDHDGEAGVIDMPFDVVLSPISAACDWNFSIPEGAKEFIILHSHGLIRRPALILKNEETGIYDSVTIFKNKKTSTPIVSLSKNTFTKNIFDEAVKGDDIKEVNRSMRILELSDDGSHLKMWISAAMDIHNDDVWHPKRLYKEVCDHVGYPQPWSMIGGGDEQLIADCTVSAWDEIAEWHSDAVLHLMKSEKLDVVFSHFHNVDGIGHMLMKFLKGGGILPAEVYQKVYERTYIQTDYYVGKYLHLLDEGWAIVMVSDHGLVCPEHGHILSGDNTGVNTGIMRELGFTTLKSDENGNLLHEIDWEKTKAVAQRGNHIYINLKGRDKYGIVEPTDKYELEEEIITALYGYKDKTTGRRVITIALRNKDAILLGMGGPECGDIIYWNAEGYNYDHGDSLSTTLGEAFTSVSPLFIAAGPGIKKGFYTDRIIREVDVAPTVAVLSGVRYPAQCEGAPIYQIFEDDI